MPWLAGTLLERPPGPKYTDALSFAELSPTGPLPKAATLAKWRRQLPAEFTLALRMPKSLLGTSDAFVADDALAQAADWVGASVDALQAGFVVVATGARITTGQRDRDRFAKLVDALVARAGADTPIVWLPGGLWEHDQATKFASKIGAACGVDGADLAHIGDRLGLADSAGGLDYTFFNAEGARQSFPPSTLAEHAEDIAARGTERAFTTISSRRSFDEAKALQELLNATRARQHDDQGLA